MFGKIECYDPNYPSMHDPYHFIEVNQVVAYNLSRYLNYYGDLFVVFDGEIIGRALVVCNKLFCQSKPTNGIFSINTGTGESIGHLIFIHQVAQKFIERSNRDFIIDETIYKRESRNRRE